MAQTAEFNADYCLVTLDVACGMPLDKGIEHEAWGSIRPFGLYARYGRPMVAVILEDDARIELELESFARGLHATPQLSAEQSAGKSDAHISFLYYKADVHGNRETQLRDIHLQLGTATIGYGVHPDHQGEAPTWYFRGLHIGFSALENGLVVPGDRVAEPQVKNFSMARIIGGPLGNPQTDPGLRERMGIAEIA